MAIVYDHKEYEKDIPKKQRDILLQNVFFSSKGNGVYEPIGGSHFNPSPYENAEFLNFGWKLWCKQQKRIEKLASPREAIPSIQTLTYKRIPC